jgi:hypothetical protein
MYNALRGLIRLESKTQRKNQLLVESNSELLTNRKANSLTHKHIEDKGNFLVQETASVNYLEFLEPQDTKLLFAKSAEISADELIVAIEKQDIKKAKFLVAKGANILKSSTSGKAIIEEALENNNKELVTAMLSIGDNAKIALYYASYKGNLDLFKFIINSKLIIIDTVDNNGFTIAQNILQKGNNDLIKSLIGCISPTNGENNDSHGDHDTDLLEANAANDLAYIDSQTTQDLGLRELENLSQKLCLISENY